MRRPALPLLLIAATAFAQTRTRAAAPPRPSAGSRTVAGTVTSVSGSLILLANGLVTIDASGATISGDATSVAAIAPGSIVFAVIKDGNVAANAPLPASFVGVSRVPVVTISGPVTAVDLANSTLTLLGRTIRVTPQTTFEGIPIGPAVHGLADITTGQVVQVDATVSGGTLLATSVRALVFAVQLKTIEGKVKSIAADAWVITSDGKDVTVAVNAQTLVVGAPKIGDEVYVAANVDSAGRYTALSIIRSGFLPTLGDFRLTGFVKTIGTTQWTIGLGPGGSLAPDFIVEVNDKTKIVGSPKVGDRVEVAGAPSARGILATSITKVP
jgi:hypothetical protein